MNYKHLSKYHYIYRLYLGFDLTAHIEKLPIIYSNKHYIYVSEPGNDELTRLTFNPYSSCDAPDVMTEVNDNTRKFIGACIESILIRPEIKCRSRFFYFLTDDPELLNEFKNYTSVKEMRRLYLESKVKDLVANMESQEEVVKKYRNRIEAIQNQISALDKEE